MEYIIHFDFAALTIMITVMLHFLYKKTISTRSTLVFTILLWVALTSTILDVLSVVTINHASVLPLWINYLLNAVYLITFNTSVALYYTYVLFNIKKNKPLTIKDKLGMFMPIGFVILLVATTPLTKLIFYFDGNFKYQHGPCMSLLYVIALYYMGVALYRTIKYSYMFTTGQKSYCILLFNWKYCSCSIPNVLS
ncbi:MAG: hypothetical protein IKM20_08650 [Erysipelotrichales bacterium]|nr:hypothetical protein [Erysipelotrichales bacterium]